MSRGAGWAVRGYEGTSWVVPASHPPAIDPTGCTSAPNGSAPPTDSDADDTQCSPSHTAHPTACMSRGGALATTLQLPAGGVEVKSVPPSGDCFYDCLHLLLPRTARPAGLASAQAMRELVADRMTAELFDLYKMCARTHSTAHGAALNGVPMRLLNDAPHAVHHPGAQLTHGSCRCRYAMAGVEDFAWLNHHRAPTSLAELKDYARRNGKEAVRTPAHPPATPPMLLGSRPLLS